MNDLPTKTVLRKLAILLRKWVLLAVSSSVTYVQLLFRPAREREFTHRPDRSKPVMLSEMRESF